LLQPDTTNRANPEDNKIPFLVFISSPFLKGIDKDFAGGPKAARGFENVYLTVM
jgi:hypothetical protein